MHVRGVQIRDVSGKELHVLNKQGDVAFFGRDKRTCHVAFDPHAARVSRVHANVEWNDENVVFNDKSKEGTMIDGTKLKQSSKVLDVGVYQIQVGGFPIVLEVEGDDLEETVLDSVESQATKFGENAAEESPSLDQVEKYDDISSISTFSFSKEKIDRKRKSDASIFDDVEPRGKRGPTARKQANFDAELEHREKRGPKARRTAERAIFEDETPAKKRKPTWEPVPSASQRLSLKKATEEPDEEITNVTSRMAAIPSVSSEAEKHAETEDQHFDRGPAAPNETIKYANLIFRPPNLKLNDTTMTSNSNVPNYKKFKPKHIKDGRVSVTSMASNTTYNTTITLVDARKIH